MATRAVLLKIAAPSGVCACDSSRSRRAATWRPRALRRTFFHRGSCCTLGMWTGPSIIQLLDTRCGLVQCRVPSTSSDSLDRTGRLVAIGVFVALAVDGMDLQMLSLALPSISKEFQLSTVTAGLLSTYTLIGMGFGGVIGGWLSDRIGRIRVVWWSVVTLYGRHWRDCLVEHVLGHRAAWFPVRLRPGLCLQHRHTAGGGVHAHPDSHDGARHAASRTTPWAATSS